jgi:hypothetical protein
MKVCLHLRGLVAKISFGEPGSAKLSLKVKLHERFHAHFYEKIKKG